MKCIFCLKSGCPFTKLWSNRIYSKTATHVIRKATIALARNFSNLEDTFNKQVDDRLNKRLIENKLRVLGEKTRKYKHEYVAINKNEIIEPADRTLQMELEDIIIKHSIEYVTYEDEALLPIKESVSRIKQINKLITSIELPMVDLPIETIKQIFDKIVIVNQENYVFVINATSTPLEKATLKKVAEMNPLLESKCKAKNRCVEYVNWKIVII